MAIHGRSGRRRYTGWAALVVPTIIAATSTAGAVTFSTMNGAPVQMQPYVEEPGAPVIAMNPGTPQPFNGPGTGGGATGGGPTGAGSSEALTTLIATSWGADAIAAAQSVGINPSALASVCVAETTTCNSNAQNGSFTGAFQMGSAAFQDGLNAALRANPGLSSQVVPGSSGINDPLTQAIAASGYMLLGNQALQNANIASPTALDYRAFHNFGPTYGVQVAQASGDALMSSVLPANYLASNGITRTMTVSEWRDKVASTIGSAANQTILG